MTTRKTEGEQKLPEEPAMATRRDSGGEGLGFPGGGGGSKGVGAWGE